MNFKKLLFLLILISAPMIAEEKPISTSSKVGVKMIDWYKTNISTLNFTHCSFYPTCSQYTKQSILKYGLVKGWIMGCDRLMRCSHELWIYPEVKVDGELKKYDPVI
jgi:uncharacterized protein